MRAISTRQAGRSIDVEDHPAFAGEGQSILEFVDTEPTVAEVASQLEAHYTIHIPATVRKAVCDDFSKRGVTPSVEEIIAELGTAHERHKAKYLPSPPETTSERFDAARDAMSQRHTEVQWRMARSLWTTLTRASQ